MNLRILVLILALASVARADSFWDVTGTAVVNSTVGAASESIGWNMELDGNGATDSLVPGTLSFSSTGPLVLVGGMVTSNPFGDPKTNWVAFTGQGDEIDVFYQPGQGTSAPQFFYDQLFSCNSPNCVGVLSDRAGFQPQTITGGPIDVSVTPATVSADPPTATPEPGTLILLSMGIGLLGVWKWRQGDRSNL